MQKSAAHVRAEPRASLLASLRAFLTYEPSGKVKPQEIVLFCRQLASFVRVGVPVTAAIDTFAEQATSKRMKLVYEAVSSDIQKGMRLSEALSAHPRVFPRIVPDMVRSAEATGNLDGVLAQAARHIQREATAQRKVRAAMTYPIVIALMAIVITTGIVIFVLPQFRTLYESLKVSPPGLLNFLLAVSSFISSNYVWILLGVLVVVVAGGFALRTEEGRFWRDSVLLRIPLLAPTVRAAATERFCRTLADMLAAGVPISQTYAVVMNNVRNRVLRQALEPVGPALASGQGLYRPIQAAGVFPPALIQMIRVGEETGRLDTSLTEAADMYEEDLEFRLKRITSFLEPALIVFVGIMVGFVAVTMITSIYSLAGGFK